jgi:hypothetical protein
MSYGWPNGLQHLSNQKLGLRRIVRQHSSYLINALGTDESLDTEPEHGQNNQRDDAEIAEPESK